MAGARPNWWQRRSVVLAAVLLAAVPLLWPAVPPLTDWGGHVGRYRILAEANRGPLAPHFAVHWALIGNLGVDLIVLALHPLLDVEPAAKLVTVLIPMLTVAAMLWLAREAHGRVPPAAGFALPLAYAYPFQFGFLNFWLAQALAFGGMAWWLRLAHTRPTAWRIGLFAPVAVLIWLCHSFGWAMLGLGVFGIELQRRRTAGASWWRAAVAAGMCCVPMALPLALMLGAGDRLQGDTGDWFNWSSKLGWLVSILRERWRLWDAAGVALLLCVLWTAIRSPRLRFAPLLAVPALLFLLAFVLLPRLFQGGSYVDMRMLPAALALGLLAIDTGNVVMASRLATAGAAFFVARTAVTTIAFGLVAREQAAVLRAVPALPAGGAVLVLVNQPSSSEWSGPRLDHLDGLAIARRRVFTNGQWALAGQQLVRPRDGRTAPYGTDPSQLVWPAGDLRRSTDLDRAVAGFDRCAFTAVWTVAFPPGRIRAPDLRLSWSDGRSAIYRVNPSACLSDRSPRR